MTTLIGRTCWVVNNICGAGVITAQQFKPDMLTVRIGRQSRPHPACFIALTNGEALKLAREELAYWQHHVNELAALDPDAVPVIDQGEVQS